jgi:hypothetical protein
MTHALKIRELNDAFRRHQGGGGKLLLTQGVSALPQADQLAILGKVARFDHFSEDNDPYGEHDFGAFEHAGERIFWKIDYYGLSMDCGSEDPSDAAKTTRVLTVMLASEY